MESFFLAEMVKYLWLLFYLAAGADNLVENGPYNRRYIFTTEGHLLPATPQISLVNEHHSYLGSFCNSSLLRQDFYTSNTLIDFQQTNNSNVSAITSFQSASNHAPVSGSIKGFRPGLTHGQRFGISYVFSNSRGCTCTKPSIRAFS